MGFKHTERQQPYRPQHQSPALDALVALAKRGTHDVGMDKLQEKAPSLAGMPASEPTGPPSPVVQEAVRRMPQEPAEEMAPAPQPPAQPPAEMPPAHPPEEMPPEAPDPDDIVHNMPEGYWSEVLDEFTKRHPVEGYDWRQDALSKFKEIRSSLDHVREYADQLLTEARKQ